MVSTLHMDAHIFLKKKHPRAHWLDEIPARYDGDDPHEPLERSKNVLTAVLTAYKTLSDARWCPTSDVCWFISPLTIDVSPINHSEIGLITYLTMGHHLVQTLGTSQLRRRCCTTPWANDVTNVTGD